MSRTNPLYLEIQHLMYSTHDDNGFLLPTSARPGGSKYQYVRKVNNSFKVVIPFDGKRHSFGPFLTEADAAQKVKSFLEQVKQGTAALARGQKRTEKFDRALQEQIDTLNSAARGENRHHLKLGTPFNVVFVTPLSINTMLSNLPNACVTNSLP